MSNDPLLGLDSPLPVEEKSKWVEVPKKRSGGYANPTRYRGLRVEGDIVAVSKPALPVAPIIEVPEPPELHLPQPIPPAYTIKKPSLFQRFLDWLLL